jgi:hypothetical protein
VNPTKLADVLWGAYRVIGQDVSEEQRWRAVAFAAIGALEAESTAALTALEGEGARAVREDDPLGELTLALAARDALIGRLREELRAVLAQYVDSDHREYEEPYWGARAESARALLAEREASG